MFIDKTFNAFWLAERKKVAEELSTTLSTEMTKLQNEIAEGSRDSDQTMIFELRKMFANLNLRRALAEYEAEEIIKRRIEARYSHFAVALSFAAFVVSVIAVFRK